MSHTEILLIKPVEGLGAEGDQVKVRNGYARNYLLPQKIGVAITAANRKQVEVLKQRRAVREAAELNDAKAVASALEKVNIAIAVKTGEGGKLFGSVTNRDIADALAKEGLEIDRKHVELSEPIRVIGAHTVPVKLAKDVSASVKVYVIAG